MLMIMRAWQHATEPNRIHYAVAPEQGGHVRRLFIDRSASGGLFELLERSGMVRPAREVTQGEIPEPREPVEA